MVLFLFLSLLPATLVTLAIPVLSAAADAGGLVATVIVITGLVLLVALFERRRARHIEHDLHDMAIARHVEPVHLHRSPPIRAVRARRRLP